MFLKLFLEWKTTISLDQAAYQLISKNNTENQNKTKVAFFHQFPLQIEIEGQKIVRHSKCVLLGRINSKNVY